MNINEKEDFINGMIDNVKEEILKKLNKMPEKWDATELRFYIKDCFGVIVWSDLKDRRSKEHRNYVHDCYVNSL